jgi:phospholipid-binding lipoprotein MlaA
MNRLLIVAGFTLMCGCASLEGPQFGVYDPYESVNRPSFKVSDWVDRNAFAPVARGYQKVTPGWFHLGVGNVFSNLREIDSAVNALLQGKPRAAGTDLMRIVINSTLGLGGLFDAATRNGYRSSEEDLGQTLAVAGITRTRFWYVPIVGPTSNRDAPTAVIRAALPRLILGSAYRWWMSGIDLLNTRAELLVATDVRDATALDPYAFTREAYYQRRKFVIFDGDPPIDDSFFDEFDEFDELDEEE